MYVSAMFARLLRGRSTPAMRAMVLLCSLSLTLFVLGINADHAHYALAVDDLALIANLLDRCSYFHETSFQPSKKLTSERRGSFISINNAPTVQVVRRELYRDFIAGQNANEVLAHLSRDMRQNLVLVFQFHFEHGIGQRFNHRCHDFNRVFFAHSLLKISFQLSACNS